MPNERIALITGANQGVGFQVAKELVANGVTVLLGSVYLLLLTNVGTRLGFLIAMTAFWAGSRSWARSGGSTAPWACWATSPSGR